MCRHCYEEMGSPCIVNDATRAAAGAVAPLFGGGLGVVTDNWNLETEHLEACEGLSKEEETCKQMLMELNVDERASAIAIAEGWL